MKVNTLEQREHSEQSALPLETSQVALYSVTQATTAVFTDLYFRQTFLFFIQVGSKRTITAEHGEIIGEAGDLMILPPGSMVTMQNRPVRDDRYRAVGVSFSDDLIESVFPPRPRRDASSGIQRVPAKPACPSDLLALIQDTVDRPDLPESIRTHRLMEPLIWLRHLGYHVPVQREESPLSQVRRLIETDLTHAWRAGEVASHFAMSESTLRRWLSHAAPGVQAGHGLSKIVLNTRLEHGLALLQTTDRPISQIALDCGFKTPSHFSDAFKSRFDIQPKAIRSASV